MLSKTWWRSSSSEELDRELEVKVFLGMLGWEDSRVSANLNLMISLVTVALVLSLCNNHQIFTFTFSFAPILPPFLFANEISTNYSDDNLHCQNEALHRLQDSLLVFGPEGGS